jgi:hypothetical protein
MRIPSYRLLFGLLAGLLACSPKAAPDVRTEQRKTTSGTLYTLFYPQNLAVRVVTSRPNVSDRRYRLSVAAAYTDLQTNRPLDLLVCSGRELQPKAKVGFLDGALTILGNTLTINQLTKGQSPPSAQLAQVRAGNGTLLLQELLVFRGQNQRAAGGSAFQRRALVEFANRRFAVIESASNNLTMKQFADDLLELGTKNALYLDMGDWDEGWYRSQGQVVKLGNRRTETARQSNWLVFTAP